MRKKRLLVVAPGLPEFDRNAGSRRLYSWLRILAIEYDIAFYMLQRRISADSNRYAQALRELGVKIHRWSCPVRTSTTFESLARPSMPIIRGEQRLEPGERAGASSAPTGAPTWL